MNTTEFYAIQNPQDCRQNIICQDGGDIKIKVLNLDSHAPYFSINEKHYFGDDHGDPLAFETIGYNNWPEEMILAGIRWYARYLDYPQMEILNDEI